MQGRKKKKKEEICHDAIGEEGRPEENSGIEEKGNIR